MLTRPGGKEFQNGAHPLAILHPLTESGRMWRDVLNRASRASGLGRGWGALVVLPWVLLVGLVCLQSAAQEGVVVTEVLASNQRILADEDGDYSDWIEIHNAGRIPVDLTGWFLTDSAANLTRWRFPATNLLEGAFLVVFASGKDRALAGAPLHTSFSLDAAGERVLLVRPDGGTVASELAFPAQATDISYGVAGGGPGHAFFPRPTPGALNGSGLTGWLAPPQFSVQRGFYEEAFLVTLTHSDPDAEIRYTLDGTVPALPWPTWIALSPPDRSGRGDGVTGLRRTYDPGMTVTATAAPTSGGHVFQKWQEAGAFLSSNAAVAVTLDRPRTLEAVYAPGALAPHKVEEAAAYTLVDSDPAPDPGENVTALPAQTLSIVSSHPDSAVLAQGPIEIHTTSTLRAVAVKPEWHPSPVETHSYLFLPAVVRQPAEVPGYPHPVLETGLAHWMSQPVRLDYEMDPDVVEALAYRAALVPALRSIPSLSLVGKVAEILGPGGVYYGDGAAAGPESVVSMELLYPEAPARNLQANAGLRPQSYPYLKRSFRLVFRDEYGDPALEADLLRDAPWNTGSVAQQFDRLILRAGGNRSFVTRWNPDDSCYTRDEWVRASQVAMSGHGSRGIFVHLYLNGLYWGLFNAVERPDHFFAASYFGGTEDEYFAINHDGPLSGDSARWDYLASELPRKDLSVPAHYQELGEYLHLESFCDYLLLNWYSGMADWPQNNWYASMRTRPEPGPVRFFAWDAEDVWDNESTSGPFDCVGCEGQRGNDGAWVPAEFLRSASKNTGPTIARLFNAAKANPDFLTLLADRAFRHLRPGGALSDTNAQARWIQINEFVREAVIAESARWGDARAGLPGEEGVLRDRDGVWQREYQRILHESMPGNPARLITALRAQGYYPGIDPPALTLPGGRIEAGSQVELLAGAGTIYYSLDGLDPRLPGGDMSAAALLYSGPITLTTNIHLKARLRSGATWSALAEAVYEATPPAVRVTEIMFHPGAPSVTEVAAGFVDAEEFEFLELHNLGAPINLAGHEFTEGIRYVFPEIQLREGGYLVLVRNPAAFALRYGTNLPIAGPFAGSLNNAGERLRLVDATGELVQEFTYDDAWRPPTDGSGFSLVIREPRAPLATWNDPGSWEASAAWGGSPGQANHPARESLADWQKRWFGLNNPLSALTADPDGDGWPNLVEFAHGLDPLTADLVNPISATIGQDASDQRKYLELSFRRRASAPEIAYLVEVSENLHPFGGEPGEVIETEVIPEPGSGLETIVLRILPSLDSGNARFVRIRIQK